MAPWTFPFVRVPTSQNFVCIVIELMLNDDQGSYRVLNFWKSLEICPVIFQTRKSLENRDEVRKGMKKSWAFFQRYNKCFISDVFFVFVKSYLSLLICLQHTTKKLLFLHFKVSIDWTYLRTTCLEKEIIVWEKVWKKSWILDPKICANPGWPF